MRYLDSSFMHVLSTFMCDRYYMYDGGITCMIDPMVTGRDMSTVWTARITPRPLVFLFFFYKTWNAKKKAIVELAINQWVIDWSGRSPACSGLVRVWIPNRSPTEQSQSKSRTDCSQARIEDVAWYHRLTCFQHVQVHRTVVETCSVESTTNIDRSCRYFTSPQVLAISSDTLSDPIVAGQGKWKRRAHSAMIFWILLIFIPTKRKKK